MSDQFAELKRAHDEARETRRALELELSQIDGKIREAISSAKAGALASLRKRKAELPDLLVEASAAETAARRAWAYAAKEQPEKEVAEAHAALAEYEEVIKQRREEHKA